MSSPNTPGFALITGLVAAIKAEPTLAALPLVRNPRQPQHLNKGNQVLVLVESTDRLVRQNGRLERRQRVVSVGALARGEAADTAADALYQLLSDTVQAGIAVMSLQQIVVQHAERQVQFHVDDLELDFDAAIVLGVWEIDYRRARST